MDRDDLVNYEQPDNPMPEAPGEEIRAQQELVDHYKQTLEEGDVRTQESIVKLAELLLQAGRKDEAEGFALHGWMLIGRTGIKDESLLVRINEVLKGCGYQ